MEIQTTMVRFRYPKAQMEQSDKAFLFIGKDDKDRTWIPFTKAEVTADPLSDKYNVVVMPKWLYMKGNLPFNSEATEFTYTHEYVAQ